MAVRYERRALTFPIITIDIVGGERATGYLSFDNEGQTVTGGRRTLARAQSINTNDAIGFVRIRQIGSGTIVEDAPMLTEGSGVLRGIETTESSLVKAGIVDFVDFLLNCKKDLLEIRIGNLCGDSPVDVLRRTKFNAVSRGISVGGGIMINQASFLYIRDLNAPFGNPRR